MGFTAAFTHILSYLGIGVLAIGILLSLAAIVPALSWLMASASATSGPVALRRIVLSIVIFQVTLLHLRSPSLYHPEAWLRTAMAAGFLLGCLAPLLALGSGRPPGRRHRGMAFLAASWWGLLLFSEALLVSGAAQQTVVLYLFAVTAGAFAGGSLGTLVTRIARPVTAGGGR
jgi:hypothetical protein